MSSTVLAPPSTPSAPALDFDQMPRQSFARLTRVELRKSLDTRSGRWVLGSMLALTVLALGWQVWHSGDSAVALTDYVGIALAPIILLLPVIGVLAMTSEWSQRTALTTFTLSPRRVPVLLAKMAAALLLSLAVLVVVAVLALAATALGGVVSGDPISWAYTWQDALGIVIANGLNVLMGVGFGAALSITGVALVVNFVAPMLFAVIAANVLKSVGPWFDVFTAFGRLSELDVDGQAWQTVTSIGLWVALPTVVGLWLSARREVK